MKIGANYLNSFYLEKSAQLQLHMKDLKNKKLLIDSTLYVSLEPCSHYGKTPPCTKLILDSGIKKVIIASQDPNPLVAGNGINFLQNKGVHVECGVLAEEAVKLNRRFYTFHQRKRPYIILKFATTNDGYIARNDFSSKWISNKYSRALVHKWRAEEMSVLVGKNTAVYDNPQLNNRFSSQKNPIRLVFDAKLEIPEGHHLLNQQQSTIVFNEYKNEVKTNLIYVKTKFNENLLTEFCQYLYSKNIQSVIVEGGSKTLQSFINQGLWDEARVFIAAVNFGSGIKAPFFSGQLIQERKIVDDLFFIYLNN